MLGGGERYPLELARAMASEVDCELITIGTRPSFVREPGGLRLRTLRALTFLHGHFAHGLAPGLPSFLADGDVIHTHQMRSTPSRLAVLATRFRHQRAVCTDHGLQGSSWGGTLPRLFDYFLAVSEYSARELHSPPRRTRVIYGGADPSRYFPDTTVERSGVLFVGRVTPHKGVDRLIRALPRNARLLIAGSEGHDPNPPERDYPKLLRQLSEGRDVRFLGAVADDDLPTLYRQARVLVLPSVHRTCYGREFKVSELLGLVAIEAMASGTPVICSRIGGLPEVVRDGVTGFLVDPGNVEELGERLSEMLGNPEMARRMGNNARELALERFTWKDCAERCLETYEQLLRPPR